MKRDMLNKEAARWESEGIITSIQREQILRLYPKDKKTFSVTVIFAVIGSLLLGAGLVLIFAFNWYLLPVPLKLILAILPLFGSVCFGVYTLMRRFSSTAFKEGAGISISFTIFASIALIGQTFHTPSELSSYIMLCVLLIIPAVYLFKSLTAAAIYSLGAMYIIIFDASLFPITLLFPVLVIPFLGKNAFCSENKILVNFVVTLLSGCVITLLISLQTHLDYYTNFFFLWSITGMILLALDISLYRWGKRYIATLPKLAGAGIVFGILAVCSADSVNGKHIFHNPSAFIVCVIIAVAYIGIRILEFSKIDKKVHLKKMIQVREIKLNDICMLISIMLVLLYPWVYIFSHIAIICVGTYYIILGVKLNSLKYLNLGMILLMYIIILRFFDSGSILLRGILFIIVGALFLSVNVFISKKNKKG